MAEIESVKLATEAAAKLKSLELLYDYTKFHIGIYLALTASYITVATIKIDDSFVLLNPNPYFVWPAIIAFMVAGLAGGVIVSSITQRVYESSVSSLSRKLVLGAARRFVFRPENGLISSTLHSGWALSRPLYRS